MTTGFSSTSFLISSITERGMAVSLSGLTGGPGHQREGVDGPAHEIPERFVDDPVPLYAALPRKPAPYDPRLVVVRRPRQVPGLDGGAGHGAGQPARELVRTDHRTGDIRGKDSTRPPADARCASGAVSLQCAAPE